MSRPDAIVVGGGLAGSAAAILLAQAEKKVVLFERKMHAHHKVCGEFLSHETVHYLMRLGVDVRALGAVAVERLRLIDGARSCTVALPFHGHSLSRHALDEALLQRARSCGADVRRGIAVTAVQPAAAGWRVESRQGGAEADAVFLASGKHDLRGLSRDGSEKDYIGFKMHYRLAPEAREFWRGQVGVVLFEGGYAGLEMIEQGIANLCLVVRKARYQALGRDWGALLDSLFAETPLLAEGFSGAEACWERPLAISGIPYGFVHRPTEGAMPGLYRLGDQMGVIPSFCGDGMAIALHTAFLAVRRSSAAYHARAHRELGGQIRLAAQLARLAASAPGRRMIMGGCAAFPALLPHLARRTRLRHFPAV